VHVRKLARESLGESLGLTPDETSPIFSGGGDVMQRAKIKDFDIGLARYLNVGIAAWLLISAFLWRHSEPQFLITILVGAVVAATAPFEFGPPMARKINTAAGGALVLAAFALPRTSTLTLWHNVIAGLVIVGISFFGPPHGTVRPRPPAPDDAYEGTGV
jgi:hypothetical protein